MVHVIKAKPNHVQGISEVCSDATRATYKDIYTQEYIERIIKEFYDPERISEEVKTANRQWGGYFVAVENGEVLGACGGGMISETAGEVFVLYLNPKRRNEGIGTKLLEAVTNQQKSEFHAFEQWVSVQKSNSKGIPFYVAKGFLYKHEQRGYGNNENEKL
ncbi:GNAT family N-acetyltransferase [Halobacillus naozhouensis]|uniref:GNAT family N-acetyltransferase n=1 Tax=Halobacillus naozhouensis TaxID=554880 RepID=A0ABY8J3R1_9BACI|nr:GNAT family N-acetyltransferase [Halobacillus naozhouensis]WFT75501.1 GNAT family N-acetyltransferase [Halobacillus naozhouensis]